MKILYDSEQFSEVTVLVYHSCLDSVFFIQCTWQTSCNSHFVYTVFPSVPSSISSVQTLRAKTDHENVRLLQFYFISFASFELIRSISGQIVMLQVHHSGSKSIYEIYFIYYSGLLFFYYSVNSSNNSIIYTIVLNNNLFGLFLLPLERTLSDPIAVHSNIH